MVAVKFSSVSVGSVIAMTPGGNFLYRVNDNRSIVCIHAPECYAEDIGNVHDDISSEEDVFLRG